MFRVKLVAKRSAEFNEARLRKKRFIPRFKGETKHSRHKRDLFDTIRYARLNKIMDRKGNCSFSEPAIDLFFLSTKVGFFCGGTCNSENEDNIKYD
jgi:hypothetical protein